MSMRTIEEEKELDELYFTFTDTSENNEEEIKRENRIKELEQKEENPQYTLIKYDIDGLSLSELQQKCIELSDEYEALESDSYDLQNKIEELESENSYLEDEKKSLYNELNEQEESYKEEISFKEDSINYLKRHQETKIGSFFNDLVGIIIFILVLTLISVLFSKIKDFFHNIFKKR